MYITRGPKFLTYNLCKNIKRKSNATKEGLKLTTTGTTALV